MGSPSPGPNEPSKASYLTPVADELRPADPSPAFLSSRKAMVLVGLLAAVMVFMVGAGLDWFVIHENESRTMAISVSDLLAAAVAGVLVYRLLQYERDRRTQLRQRLEIIADMNHHVRNALQVISFSGYSSDDKQQLERIREGVNRIQWALKEILPKL